MALSDITGVQKDNRSAEIGTAIAFTRLCRATPKDMITEQGATALFLNHEIVILVVTQGAQPGVALGADRGCWGTSLNV